MGDSKRGEVGEALLSLGLSIGRYTIERFSRILWRGWGDPRPIIVSPGYPQPVDKAPVIHRPPGRFHTLWKKMWIRKSEKGCAPVSGAV